MCIPQPAHTHSLPPPGCKAEEDAADSRKEWPKTMCAGMWFRTPRLAAWGKSVEVKRVEVPPATYSTKGVGWAGEPTLVARINKGTAAAPNVVNITGTARANDCTHFTSKRHPFIDYMCKACSEIPKMRSFQWAIGVAKEKETCAGPPVYVDDYDPKTRNNNLHRDHLEHWRRS